jgi:hypothetical protein
VSGRGLVGIVLMGAMLGVWGVRSFTASDDTATQRSATTPTVATEPSGTGAATSEPHVQRSVVASGEVRGVPVGYPASGVGAATAAVNWVASFPTLVRMGPIRLTDTLDTLLSQRRAASGTEEVIADYFTLIDELGSDFGNRIWIESPLQVDVTAVTDRAATVAVWSMLTTGDRADDRVEAIWRTHRIGLIWERDDWRIDDVSIVEGPTPVANDVALPSPASEFLAVDGWEPAVFAATTAWGED